MKEKKKKIKMIEPAKKEMIIKIKKGKKKKSISDIEVDLILTLKKSTAIGEKLFEVSIHPIECKDLSQDQDQNQNLQRKKNLLKIL